MSEKPLPFTEDMVRAGLAGLKTKTRRVAKLNASGRVQFKGRQWHVDDPNAVLACPYGQPGNFLWVRERMRVIRVRTVESGMQIRVRYEADGTKSGWIPYPERLKGQPDPGKCLSYGGYREASRLTLKLTEVRLERLQDISDSDALNEGVSIFDAETVCPGYARDAETAKSLGVKPPLGPSPVEKMRWLWDSINAKRGYGWDVNPLVWVLGFERHEERGGA